MTQELLEAKSALKALVDTFSNLADETRITDQMLLLTPDSRVQVYMGDDLLVDMSGTQQVEETFTAFTHNVKRSFHMNGQHVVEVDVESSDAAAHRLQPRDPGVGVARLDAGARVRLLGDVAYEPDPQVPGES
jgi:hypothetical protein